MSITKIQKIYKKLLKEMCNKIKIFTKANFPTLKKLWKFSVSHFTDVENNSIFIKVVKI